MSGTKTSTIEQQISPTMLSSDLFTPLREPRVTLPTIGKHTYDSGTHGREPWGGSLATYGGTGALLIQGRLRDLNEGRSHRHYGSGLGNHPTTAQPYRLTALKPSDCRVNDQRLTTCLTDLVSTTWQREAWPSHHPYFSHRSIFDVFPSGVFSEEHASSKKKTVVHPVSETTLTALRDVHHHLYQTTLYRDYFRAQTIDNSAHVSTGNLTTTFEDERTAMSAYTGTDDLAENYGEEQTYDEEHDEEQEVSKGDRNGSKETSRCKTGEANTDGCDDTVRDLLDKLLLGKTKRGQMKLMSQCQPQSAPPLVYCPKAPPRGASIPPMPTTQSLPTPPLPRPLQRPPAPLPHMLPSPPTLKPPLMSLSPTHKLNNLPDVKTVPNGLGGLNDDSQQCMTDKDKGLHQYGLTFALGDRVQGIGPCWPPSTTQLIDKIRGTQLLERHELSGVPETYYSTLQPRSQETQSSTVYDHSIIDNSAERNRLGSSYGIDDYQLMMYRDGRPYFTPELSASLSHKTREEYKMPQFERKADDTVFYLPPVSHPVRVVPSGGSNIPQKLGLRFKTEAQWRFHKMHPEIVPDLRSTRNFRKKYFFFGHHSSAIRG